MQAIILYSTTTRRTESVAARLAEQFSHFCDARVAAIENWDLTATPSHDLIIAGGPTAGRGELHIKWRRVASDLAQLDMRGRYVAVFALGDQRHHGATFGNALWLMHTLWSKTGATLVGQTRFEGYWPDYCPQLRHGQLLPGLLLDHIGQRRLTSSRVDNWAAQLRGQMTLQAQRRVML